MDYDKELRKHIKQAINVAELGIDSNEELRLEDQLMELVGAYKRAPTHSRDQTYRKGEQRILHSFRPPVKSKTKKMEYGAS
jgi:hypothetical protein